MKSEFWSDVVVVGRVTLLEYFCGLRASLIFAFKVFIFPVLIFAPIIGMFVWSSWHPSTIFFIGVPWTFLLALGTMFFWKFRAYRDGDTVFCEYTDTIQKQKKERITRIVDVARICHEVNRVCCLAMGDKSQLPWTRAPKWQRESVIMGVAHAVENPSATPADSHKGWLAEKKKEGWKYGPVKDVEKKEHPCILPYRELPRAQQLKDELFLAIVGTFL